MAMSAATQEIFEAICSSTEQDGIIVATYSWAFRNRAAANAAFRAAHKANVIEPSFRSTAGNIVWKKVGA